MPNNMGHSLEMFQINAASNVQEKDESMNICSCEAKHEHFYSLTNHGATICCVIYNLLTNYFKIYQKVPCQIPWKETFGNGNPAHRWSCLCALSWRNMMSYQACFHTSHVSVSVFMSVSVGVPVSVCVWTTGGVGFSSSGRLAMSWAWSTGPGPGTSRHRHLPAGDLHVSLLAPDDARSW